MLRKLVGRVSIRILKAMGNLTHTFTDIEILELGPALFLESHIVTREMCFGKQTIESAKFT